MEEAIIFLISQGYVVQFAMGIDDTMVQAIYPGNPPFSVIFEPTEEGALTQAVTELLDLAMEADAE